MIRKSLSLFSMLLLAGLVGCGGLKEAEGTVTYDGNAVDGATVSFINEDGKGQAVSGFTDSSGKFVLMTGKKKGAPPGSYKVTVTKVKGVTGDLKPGSPEAIKAMKEAATRKSELPPKYGDPAKTDLKVTIPSPGPIELKLTK